MALSTSEFSVPSKVRALSLDDDPDLLRHVKRPHWGLAILASEKADRRSYQFEDGRKRTFKRGYYDLMQPATSERRSDDAVIADLQAALGVDPSPRELLVPIAPFEEQIGLFEALYPEGFLGEAWTHEKRGTPTGRDLKRHRDPAIESAQSALSAERVGTLVSEENLSKIAEIAVETLSSTNLVSNRPLKALRRMDAQETARFGQAVADLLHGEGDYSPRFKGWVETLKDVIGAKPSWRLTTALPALLEPAEHVCVRHSAFIRQAAVIAPTSKYTRRPRVRSYRNFRRVASGVRTRLEAAGHEPRDFVDVHDFVWATLRNSALDHLKND